MSSNGVSKPASAAAKRTGGRRKGWRNLFANILVAAVTVVLVSLAFEIAVRHVLDPLDFLSPTLIRDDDLGYRIAPYSGGHDAWGFRNHGVPDRADIVAIGDSMTYGLAAPAARSWPATLAKISGLRTYNLGVSGYGPVEYTKLLATRATKLSPRIVVIGLFVGNDLRDAYMTAAGETDPQIESVLVPGNQFEQARRWLSGNSMLYGLMKAALPELAGRISGRFSDPRLAEGVLEVGLWGKHIGLTPRFLLRTLDIGDAHIASGLERTIVEVRSITRLCGDRNLSCYFVLLPTKESVLEPLVAESLTAADGEMLRRVVSNEASLANTLRDAIASAGATVIDPLGDLRAAARQEAIYEGTDNHPNGAGYEVIARTIWRAIAPSESAGSDGKHTAGPEKAAF